jgi:hypothetical protein
VASITISKIHSLPKVNCQDKHANIINSQKKNLCIKTGELRQLAKEYIKEGKDISEYLKNADKNVYEEWLFFGLLIYYSKIPDKEKILWTKKYLANVDCWAEIDMIACKAKYKFDEDLYYDFCKKCLTSKKEYTVRFGVIFLMTNFIGKKEMPELLSAMDEIKIYPYYVKMGLAWFYSVAALSAFDDILICVKELLASGNEDLIWTGNKTIQKIKESYRYTDKQKKTFEKLRSK